METLQHEVRFITRPCVANNVAKNKFLFLPRCFLQQEDTNRRRTASKERKFKIGICSLNVGGTPFKVAKVLKE